MTGIKLTMQDSLVAVVKPHGPAGPSEWVPGEGYVAKCVCGQSFSSWSWAHVPRLYDHIAAVGARG